MLLPALATLTGFDYTDRTFLNVQDLFFKVETSSGLYVWLRNGRFQTSTTHVVVPEQRVGPFVPPAAPNSRIDLVYIATDGTPTILQGAAAVNPSAPDYKGRLVVAEITVANGAVSIAASNIKDVRSFITEITNVDDTSIEDSTNGLRVKPDGTSIERGASGLRVKPDGTSIERDVNGLRVKPDGTSIERDVNGLRVVPSMYTNSLGSSGYQKLFGGLYLMWGVKVGSESVEYTISLPITLSNALVYANGSATSVEGGTNGTFTYSYTKTSFKLRSRDNGPYHWFAIGY